MYAEVISIINSFGVWCIIWVAWVICHPLLLTTSPPEQLFGTGTTLPAVLNPHGLQGWSYNEFIERVSARNSIIPCQSGIKGIDYFGDALTTDHIEITFFIFFKKYFGSSRQQRNRKKDKKKKYKGNFSVWGRQNCLGGPLTGMTKS